MGKGEIGSGEATEMAEAALRELLEEVAREVRLRVLQRVGEVIELQRQHEREQCVGVCRRRADLWRNTSQSRSSLAIAREEARARANEAAYLADLLAAGEDIPDIVTDKVPTRDMRAQRACAIPLLGMVGFGAMRGVGSITMRKTLTVRIVRSD